MGVWQAKRLLGINVRWSSVFGLVGGGMSISGSGRAVRGYEDNLTNADRRWFESGSKSRRGKLSF